MDLSQFRAYGQQKLVGDSWASFWTPSIFPCYLLINIMEFSCHQGNAKQSHLKLCLLAWNIGLTRCPTNTDAGPVCSTQAVDFHDTRKYNIDPCTSENVLHSTENSPRYISRPHGTVLLWSGTNTCCCLNNQAI